MKSYARIMTELFCMFIDYKYQYVFKSNHNTFWNDVLQELDNYSNLENSGVKYFLKTLVRVAAEHKFYIHDWQNAIVTTDPEFGCQKEFIEFYTDVIHKALPNTKGNNLNVKKFKAEVAQKGRPCYSVIYWSTPSRSKEVGDLLLKGHTWPDEAYVATINECPSDGGVAMVDFTEEVC